MYKAHCCSLPFLHFDIIWLFSLLLILTGYDMIRVYTTNPADAEKNEVRIMSLNEIMEAVAEQNGTTVEVVRREMELAISSARETPGFKAIFGDEIPSIEEFILVGAVTMQILQPNAS